MLDRLLIGFTLLIVVYALLIVSAKNEMLHWTSLSNVFFRKFKSLPFYFNERIVAATDIFLRHNATSTLMLIANNE